jgi:hypothetical protein
MNLKSMFNALLPGQSSASPSPASISSAPGAVPTGMAPGTGGGYSAGSPPESLDAFEKRYAAYVGGSYHAGRFTGICPVPIPSSLVETIVAEASPFSKADLAALAENFKTETRYHSRLSEIHFFSSTKILQQAQAEVADALRRGETAARVPTRQEVVNAISSEREILRGLLREVYAANFKILETACKKFESVARQKVAERDQEEIEQHNEDFGDQAVRFEPSNFLKALCWVALSVANAPISNFELCGNSPAPTLDELAKPSQIWARYIPRVRAAIQQVAKPAPQPAATETISPADEQAEATRKQRHAAELAEKNQQVDEIKKLASMNEDERNRAIAERQTRAAKAASPPATNPAPAESEKQK